MKPNSTAIHFTATPLIVRSHMLIRLPEVASNQLPSRGQVAVIGAIDTHEFQTVLEPDGYWGHFMKISKDLQKHAAITAGTTVTLKLTPSKEWPEPTVPKDFAVALAAASQKVKDKWHDITPMARWEWIRWVNATGNTDTRAMRIKKSISKLDGKHRRPCCFNLAACTVPELSRNGRLIEPTTV